MTECCIGFVDAAIISRDGRDMATDPALRIADEPSPSSDATSAESIALRALRGSDTPEWVRWLTKNAKYVGDGAAALAIVLGAVEIVIGAGADACRKIAKKFRDEV